MENLSRRNMLRLMGGAAGADGPWVPTRESSGSGLLGPTPTPTPTPSTATTSGPSSLAGDPADRDELAGHRVGRAGRGGRARPGGAAHLRRPRGAAPPARSGSSSRRTRRRLLPVISYKVGGDAAGAASGTFNAVADQAAARLASYGLPTAVTFWHEPNRRHDRGAVRRGEQAAAADLQARRAAGRSDPQRVAARQPECRPSRRTARTSCSTSGTGSASTPTSPGPWTAPAPRKPADRIPALSEYLKRRAATSLPLGVGEYNGYSAETIAAAGEALLSTPNVWFGCVWNSDGWQGRRAHRRPPRRVPGDPGRPAQRGPQLTLHPPRHPSRGCLDDGVPSVARAADGTPFVPREPQRGTMLVERAEGGLVPMALMATTSNR